MRVRVQRTATMTCAGCGETEADGAIFESADRRCFRCNRPALQIPNAEVKAPPPKRRPKCGPSLSKTRSAEEAAAHAIKMRQLPATEKRVYATRSPQAAAAHAIKMREMLAAEEAEIIARADEHERKLRERKLREQVRPDFVVCSASVTVRRDHFAASQKLRREQQERDAALGSEPSGLVVKIAGQACLVLMLCRPGNTMKHAGRSTSGSCGRSWTFWSRSERSARS